MAFLKLGFKPDPEKYVLCEYYVEAPDLRKAGEELGAESSIGTWTKIGTMKHGILERLGARVYSINGNIIKIAYPVELFEDNNMPQFLSDVAGNIFGMKGIKNLRFLDFQLPRKYTNTYPGPSFGRGGVRKRLGTLRSRRPHIGTIVKPKVGLNPKETAKVAYEAWAGGIDFVKDDENLTSQRFCPFKKRFDLVFDAKDRAEKETGEKKMYAPNITASAEVMLERAEYVKERGSDCIMIDIITAGFSGLQYISFTHHNRLFKNIFKFPHIPGSINSEYGKHKPLFSVCSGGLAPANVPDLMRIFGNDIVIQAGGGVHGHPDGTRSGATALRQAVDASIKGIPLKTYARTHRELARSPEKWRL
ncbi:MAG: RuBisCO large subunit C-terminal-like domain-containing protein [Candidatus Micrarchaeota archaeon]